MRVCLELAHHHLQHLRLDGEDDEVRIARGLKIAFSGADAEALLEPVAAIIAGMTCDYVLPESARS